MISREPDAPEDQDGADDAALVNLWRSEIQRGQKSAEAWAKDAKDIVERYRAEGAKHKGSRYALLWSNVQTLGPALYHKAPKAVVQRRYLDRDPVGRIACRILERAVQYQVDQGELHRAVKICVDDRLLGGRGTVWCRYEPTIETDGDGDESPAVERIKAEIVHVDYVNPEDFVHEPARIWDEVNWVAKRVFLTRDELVDRFGDIGKEVKLTLSPDLQDDAAKNATPATMDAMSKAGIWEIWNKSKREVIWLADEFPKPLKVQKDPLGLEGFFPCPAPLFATTTSGTLVPVPDYKQYASQADEMDTLTKRISRLIDAIRVRGVYDMDFQELSRILSDDTAVSENSLTPVRSWASFAEKKGMDGAIQFLPIEMFVQAVTELYKARDVVKAEVYEITGLSDILRGQGDPDETATGVKEKGRFATLRLQNQQERVAVFVRDIVRIMAEITCMLFQPETLAEMASVEEMDELQIPAPQMPMAGLGAGMPAGPVPPQHLPMMAG